MFGAFRMELSTSGGLRHREMSHRVRLSSCKDLEPNWPTVYFWTKLQGTLISNQTCYVLGCFPSHKRVTIQGKVRDPQAQKLNNPGGDWIFGIQQDHHWCPTNLQSFFWILEALKLQWPCSRFLLSFSLVQLSNMISLSSFERKVGWCLFFVYKLITVHEVWVGPIPSQ